LRLAPLRRKDDPVAGSVSGNEHFQYVLRHADDNLVIAQRYGEWISRGPELEEDIALANIGLDHLGQARSLLTHAGDLEGGGRTEDDLAMFRTEREFQNLTLVEQPNGDFGATIARAFLFDTYQVGLWEALSSSSDPTLAGIARKAHKEARYHHRHSIRWVIRLGDGTEESHRRMQNALSRLWPLAAEMFTTDDVDRAMAERGIGVDPARLYPQWSRLVGDVIDEATLQVPQEPAIQTGGRSGRHSEHLGHLVAEMQWLQRSMPGLRW
jgi:ring-1,2-phenylacetyl-CoA epoxidase subunit PaaC